MGTGPVGYSGVAGLLGGGRGTGHGAQRSLQLLQQTGEPPRSVGALESCNQFWLGHDQRGNLKHVPSPSKFRVVVHKNRDSVSCPVDEPRDVSKKPVTKGRSTPSVRNS